MPVRLIHALILILATAFVVAPSAAAQSAESGNDSAGWRFKDVEIGPESPVAGSVATVRFRIEDAYGNSVPGLRATGLLRAPSTAYDDSPPPPSVTTIGRELSEPGQYEVAVALNQPGRWWIEVRVNDAFGQVARYDHFAIVDAVDEPAPATTTEPIFLRGDDWQHFYRVDPDTGGVVTLQGEDLFQIGQRFWITDFNLQERGSISSRYGGTWRLSLNVRDAISGIDITTINLGDVRANVFSGSAQDPAIATAINIAPDGSAAYIYWARKLGDGWIAHLAEADPLTGEVRNQKVLNGAIVSNGFWAEIYLRDDGHIVVAEQVVELASVSGYRLSLIERGSLNVVSQYRETDARNDPLTHCMLAYPGPTGAVSGEAGNRYSLCSPPDSESERALLVWNPIDNTTEHLIDLGDIVNDEASFADGVASPDNTRFYAVNTRTLRIAEIDMVTGEVLRLRNLFPAEDDDDPSTLDRFFDWVFGAWTPSASAAGVVESSVTISADGATLYVISTPENREPGLLVIDVANLEIVDSLMTGETIDGLISTSDDRIAVIQRDSDAEGDAITVLNRDGRTQAAFTLPGRSDIVGSRR